MPSLRENVGSLQVDIANITRYQTEQQTTLNVFDQKECDLDQEIVTLGK